MSKREQPLVVDLFCGLGGWTDGLMAEGWDVIGFDIERHVYGEQRYPAQLVIQDVLTLHGSQFRTADLIVASPPCQEFSYMAMPWSLAKEKRRKIKADPAEQKRLTALFDACFRLQREACEAAGRHIPLIVENVRGAQEWVGRARWNFGSFYLWGDVPALMPATFRATKIPGFRFDGSGRSLKTASVDLSGVKAPGMNWSAHGQPGYKPQGFNVTNAQRSRQERDGIKQPSDAGRRTAPGNGARFMSRDCGVEVAEGRKGAGAGAEWFDQNLCALSSKSDSRKAASAMIAKIPLPLSRHIARVYAGAS